MWRGSCEGGGGLVGFEEGRARVLRVRCLRKLMCLPPKGVHVSQQDSRYSRKRALCPFSSGGRASRRQAMDAFRSKLVAVRWRNVSRFDSCGSSQNFTSAHRLHRPAPDRQRHLDPRHAGAGAITGTGSDTLSSTAPHASISLGSQHRAHDIPVDCRKERGRREHEAAGADAVRLQQAAV